MNKEQVLARIGGLQRTRQYADEVERARLTVEIEQLFRQYDQFCPACQSSNVKEMGGGWLWCLTCGERWKQ